MSDHTLLTHVSLLPPNATPLEREMEVVTADLLLPIDFDCRLLWSAELCPTQLLPWLASALGTDDWDDNWSDQEKRSAVANAIDIQSTKGTIYSIKKTANNFGIPATIQEYRNHPNDLAPCNYQIIVEEGTEDIQKSIEKAMFKAVRASDAFVLAHNSYGQDSICMIGVGRCVDLQRYHCSTN